MKIASKYIGLITGILMVAASLILFYPLHLPVTGSNQYIILSLLTMGVLVSLVLYSKQPHENTPTFKDYFTEGFKTFIVVVLIMAIYTFVFYKFNTQILETAIKESNELIIKQGDKTPAEIEANAQKLRSIFMPMMITVTTIKFLIIGALVSVVGAGFLSQKK
ncbi:DUF4199 domain-containing protein [Ferruginibacter yonginensis]|uniref:DUF4199 domain-containing protein n=1 Tax=Ferruginibacter yonginensis TaxID=1310416 RepID=A0ABV8QQP8_9BACT